MAQVFTIKYPSVHPGTESTEIKFFEGEPDLISLFPAADSVDGISGPRRLFVTDTVIADLPAVHCTAGWGYRLPCVCFPFGSDRGRHNDHQTTWSGWDVLSVYCDSKEHVRRFSSNKTVSGADLLQAGRSIFAAGAVGPHSVSGCGPYCDQFPVTVI